MTDISIIGAGCLLASNAFAMFWLHRYAKRNADLQERLQLSEQRGDMWLNVVETRGERIAAYEAAEAKRQAQRIAAGKKGREAQAAAKLAKKAAGQ
jgi:hypothetical protein